MAGCVYVEAKRDGRFEDPSIPSHCVNGQCRAVGADRIVDCCRVAGTNVKPTLRRQTLLDLLRRAGRKELEPPMYLGLLAAVHQVEQGEGERLL